jgi:hypothetical protein
VVVGVGDVSSSRFRSLWRSGRTSKVDGGGRPGAEEAAACTAGVAQAVGGIEARAEAGAWGVAAADMVVSRLCRQWRRERCGRVCCLARRADQAGGCRLALYDCNTRVPADACPRLDVSQTTQSCAFFDLAISLGRGEWMQLGRWAARLLKELVTFCARSPARHF